MRTQQAANIIGMALDYRLASERRIAELETEVRMLREQLAAALAPKDEGGGR